MTRKKFSKKAFLTALDSPTPSVRLGASTRSHLAQLLGLGPPSTIGHPSETTIEYGKDHNDDEVTNLDNLFDPLEIPNLAELPASKQPVEIALAGVESILSIHLDLEAHKDKAPGSSNQARDWRSLRGALEAAIESLQLQRPDLLFLMASNYRILKGARAASWKRVEESFSLLAAASEAENENQWIPGTRFRWCVQDAQDEITGFLHTLWLWKLLASSLEANLVAVDPRGRWLSTLHLTARYLCRVFAEYYRPPASKDQAQEPQRRADFIVAALDAVGIQHPADERLFRDYIRPAVEALDCVRQEMPHP